MSFKDDINRFKRVSNRTQRAIQYVTDKQQERQEKREHEEQTQADYDQLPTYAKQLMPLPTQQQLKPPSTAANLFYATLTHITAFILFIGTESYIAAFLSPFFFPLTCYIFRKIRDDAFETKAALGNTTQSTATTPRPKSALGDLVPHDELPPEYRPAPAEPTESGFTERELQQSLGDLAPQPDALPAHTIVNPYAELTKFLRYRHTYVLGKTGMGKSTLLKNLICADLVRISGNDLESSQHGVIVLSPERKMLHEVMSYLPSVPDIDERDILYFDPTDNREPIVGFNPFHFDAPDDPHEREHLLYLQAGEVYTIFIRALGEQGVRMRTLFQNMVSALLQYPDATIRDLERLVDPDDASLRREVATHEAIDERTQRFWKRYEESTFFQGIQENVMNRFEMLLRPPLVDVLTTNSFSFHNLLNEQSKSILLFDLSGLRGEDQRVFGQLLLASIQQTLFRRDARPESEYHSYYMYIDEFQTFAHTATDSMLELFNKTRKYHVGITLAHQVTANLPSELRSTIIGNVGSMYIMGLAGEDARYFASELQLHEYTQTDDGKIKRGGTAPNYIQDLGTGETFIKTPKLKTPIVAKVAENPTEYLGLMEFPELVDEIKAKAKARHGATRTPPPDATTLDEQPDEHEAHGLTGVEKPPEDDQLFPVDDDEGIDLR